MTQKTTSNGECMKKIAVLALLAGMLLGGVSSAQAVDFKAAGRWIFGFGAADASFVKNPGTRKSGTGHVDSFDARQMLRLRLEAVASESLSGVVYFEVGNQKWGKASQGAALGADGTVVKVKHAFIDWVVPQTALRLRMGLQAVDLPNAAGGSAVLADDVAGITASYRINDAVALTGMWGRPYNDNYVRGDSGYNGATNSLDNMDIFMLSLPVTLDGWQITPWALLAATGRNAVPGIFNETLGNPNANYYVAAGYGTAGFNTASLNRRGNPYSTAWWVGLPIKVTALDPWNFELDINYGASEGFGKYDAVTARGETRRASSRREGWLVKGLAEYKMDWGTPGLFAWYGSGDQGVGNGSGRMPYIGPWGSFTSFLGDNSYAWSVGGGSTRNSGFEVNSVYTGSWGVGAQVKDISFIESLTHVVRVSYWGGTNSPSMTKYMTDLSGGLGVNGAHSKGWDRIDESYMYLTTKDWLLEFNLDSTWQIYDNLKASLELGYVVNGIDRSQWTKYGNGASWQKADAWKAALIVCYQF